MWLFEIYIGINKIVQRWKNIQKHHVVKRQTLCWSASTPDPGARDDGGVISSAYVFLFAVGLVIIVSASGAKVFLEELVPGDLSLEYLFNYGIIDRDQTYHEQRSGSHVA